MFIKSPQCGDKTPPPEKICLTPIYWCVYEWRFTETKKKVKKSRFPPIPPVEIYALKPSLGVLTASKCRDGARPLTPPPHDTLSGIYFRLFVVNNGLSYGSPNSLLGGSRIAYSGVRNRLTCGYATGLLAGTQPYGPIRTSVREGCFPRLGKGTSLA